MLNIGNRPTIGNGETVSIEVNLLDYKGDLYGQWMKIEFVARLRKEERFVSRDELKEQLRQDEQATRAILAD
jgi:riboflavin kinase/FMN adenylyltransferase